MTHQLGQGGMGSVWAAVHQTLGREVAVKFLQPQTPNPVQADRFVSEAHMVASIKHRFVVDVFDFGVTEDGLHYMVLELLQGRSLAHRMDSGPALSVRQAVRLMADCLRGLHVVHEAGIIHRDLKPDNVFVIEDADGVFPKLIDFGISRRTEPGLKLHAGDRPSRLTQPGTVLGTPYYMSPEQLRARNVDCRADIYSIGVMLYELLVGCLPYREDNLGDLMVAITVKGPPALIDSRPDLGVALSDVVRRALSPKAEQRYPSALALREELMTLLPHLPEGALCTLQQAGMGSISLDKTTSMSPDHLELPVLHAEPHMHDVALANTDPAPPQAQSSRHLWLGVVSALAFAALVWTVARELVPSAAAPLHTHDDPPPTAAIAPAPTQPEKPALPQQALQPLPRAAPNAPGMASDASKVARPRARPHDAHDIVAPAPRSAAAPNERQKVYRKLDF